MPNETDNGGSSDFEDDVVTAISSHPSIAGQNVRAVPGLGPDDTTAVSSHPSIAGQEPEGNSGFERDITTVRRPNPMMAGQDGGGVPKAILDEVTVPVHIDASTAGLIGTSREAAILTIGHFGDPLPDLSVPAPAKKELVSENLAPDYERMISALCNFGILDVGGVAKEGDAHPPTFDQIKTALSPEILKFVSTFQQPVLLLTPNTSFNSKIKAIREKALEGSIQGLSNIEANPLLHYWGEQGPNTITRWCVSIVEGSSVVSSQSSADLATQLRLRGEQKTPIDAGMNIQKYLMLTMLKSNNGGVDTQGMTLIDRELFLRTDQVVQAFCTDGKLYFNIVRAGGSESLMKVPDNSYFRSSVDVKLAEENEGK